jgi:hypothetical protein
MVKQLVELACRLAQIGVGMIRVAGAGAMARATRLAPRLANQSALLALSRRVVMNCSRLVVV